VYTSYLVNLGVLEITVSLQKLTQNYFRDNFVICIPILILVFLSLYKPVVTQPWSTINFSFSTTIQK